MGEIWRGRDDLLDRTVAIKLIRPEYADSSEFRMRLRTEARHAGLLSHPGVVQIHDYDEGSAERAPFLVMEYVDGPSLAEVLAAEGTLTPRRVLTLIEQTAVALHCAHSAGLVHRDVKPANLLLCGDQVKVADFGLARAVDGVPLTRTGMVLGTPHYMSPEQVRGQSATAASDLYALGVIAYECLTGRPPFEGSAISVALAHRDRPMPVLPEGVPARLAELVSALTSKDPRDRPADGLEVAGRARRLLADSEITRLPAGPVVLDPPPPQVRRRHPRVLSIVGLAGLVMLAGWAGWGADQLVSGTSQAAAPAATRVNVPKTGGATVDPAAYYGIPADAAALRLRALGLRVQTVGVPAVGRARGTVTGLTPSGDVPPGTLITLFAAAPVPPPTQVSTRTAPAPTRAAPAPAPAKQAPAHPGNSGKGKKKKKGDGQD